MCSWGLALAQEELHTPGWTFYKLADLHHTTCHADASVSHSYCLYQGRPAWFYVYRMDSDGFGILYASIANIPRPQSAEDWTTAVLATDAMLPYCECTSTDADVMEVYFFAKSPGTGRIDLMRATTSQAFRDSGHDWQLALIDSAIETEDDFLPRFELVPRAQGDLLAYCTENGTTGQRQVRFIIAPPAQSSAPVHADYALDSRQPQVNTDTELAGDDQLPGLSMQLCASRPLVIDRQRSLLYWATKPDPGAADWQVYDAENFGPVELLTVHEIDAEPLVICKLNLDPPPAPDNESAGRSVPALWSPQLQRGARQIPMPELAPGQKYKLSTVSTAGKLFMMVETLSLPDGSADNRILIAAASLDNCMDAEAWSSYELVSSTPETIWTTGLYTCHGNPLVLYYLNPPEQDGKAVEGFPVMCAAASKPNPVAASDWNIYGLGVASTIMANYNSCETHFDWPTPATGYIDNMGEPQACWQFFFADTPDLLSADDWRKLALPLMISDDNILAPLAEGACVTYVASWREDDRMHLYFGIPTE